MSLAHDRAYSDLSDVEHADLVDPWATSFPAWAARVAATDPVIVALEELGFPSPEHTHRPSADVRRRFAQERAARAALAPRTGHVAVLPAFPLNNDDGARLHPRAA